jgi:hypothetical protein
MTCEELVIGSVAGLALTAGLLSFQVLTDRKAARTEDRKLPVVLLLISMMKLIGMMKLYFMIYMHFI